jgi:hypothetical protein
MAFLLKGPLGQMSGKAGNVVGLISKGRNLLSSLRSKSNRPPTDKQQDQRLKFGLVTHFLAGIGDLIDIGFSNHGEYETAMNAAVAYNLKHAVTGVSPDFSIDPKMLAFSYGSLIEPQNAAAQAIAGAQVGFSWMADASIRKLSNPGDMLMVLAYNPNKKDSFVTHVNVAERSDLSYVLQLPASYTGDVVHTYLAFAGLEGKVSDTVYVGAVTII